MADTLTTITNLINSPPGQLVAGGVLAGIVWKFFERVEAVLNEDTKLEIAVWLLGVKTAEKVQGWPDTFAKVFDRVFGTKHLSWKCFWRSCVASYLIVFIVISWESSRPSTYASTESPLEFAMTILYYSFFGNVLPDYVSLLETRYVLGLMRSSQKPAALI